MKKVLLFVSCLCLMSLACRMSAAQAVSQKEVTPTVPAVEFEGPTRIRVVCADSLHVRKSPMGEVAGYVYGGELIEVFEPVEGWSQVAAGRWRGLWVRESWLCEDGE